MERKLPFTKEHDMFREAFGNFLDKEAVPYYDEWCKKHQVPHEYYEKMGELGYMAMWIDPKYGGAGCTGDYLYTVIKAEEYSKRGLNCIFSRLSGDVVTPYIDQHGTEEQKAKWLPQIAKGKVVMAVCMTEPDHGSDLANIETKAEDMGDYYLVNGTKTFISNGTVADLFVVAVRTNPNADKPHRGISLMLIEANREGVSASLSTASASRPRTLRRSTSTTLRSPRRTCWARRTAASICLCSTLRQKESWQHTAPLALLSTP